MTIRLVMELIGTVAFALSGAMVAVQKKLDLLGIIVLGEVTAVGGGMFRDLLIGCTPPVLFREPVYVSTALAAVLLFFVLLKCRIVSKEFLETEMYEWFMNLFDAVGLGAFTVVGIDAAIQAGFTNYLFLQIFLGVLTGVGGGVMRDVMAGTTLFILKKHVYACASFVGACVYVGLLRVAAENIALVVSALLIVGIRLCARRYKWNLPGIE